MRLLRKELEKNRNELESQIKVLKRELQKTLDWLQVLDEEEEDSWETESDDDSWRQERAMQAGMMGGVGAYNEVMGHDSYQEEECGHQCRSDCPRCGEW